MLLQVSRKQWYVRSICRAKSTETRLSRSCTKHAQDREPAHSRELAMRVGTTASGRQSLSWTPHHCSAVVPLLHLFALTSLPFRAPRRLLPSGRASDATEKGALGSHDHSASWLPRKADPLQRLVRRQADECKTRHNVAVRNRLLVAGRTLSTVPENREGPSKR